MEQLEDEHPLDHMFLKRFDRSLKRLKLKLKLSERIDSPPNYPRLKPERPFDLTDFHPYPKFKIERNHPQLEHKPLLELIDLKPNYPQLEHEHPLDLIDLQPNYPHYKEEYEDEEEDWVTKWDFSNQCSRCRKQINFYHRYYYNCSDSSCDYLLHKFCGDLPSTLKHTSHCARKTVSYRDLNHTLTLIRMGDWWVCDICYSYHNGGEVGYNCSRCHLRINVKCAMRDEENSIIYHEMIYHPSHPHPLVINSKQISSQCDACGKEHRGIFYNCTKCPCLSIHSDCIFLPRKLHNDHTHQLNLSYSFSKEEKQENFMPRCRICSNGFEYQFERLWIYKCEKCRYYAHLDCATSREELFISAGIGKTIKNFNDVDHPDLVHLPFPDQTYNIWQLPFFNEKLLTTNEGGDVNLNHISHRHPLCLVTTSTTNDICHNPMKKKEVLCNGCIRPIMTTRFYKCTKGCNFLLHEQCTRLPYVVENHPVHPKHPLVLILEPKLHVFICDHCASFCNGFSYGCIKCDFFIDVNCALIPDKITHEAHPNHLLSRVNHKEIITEYCSACLESSISPESRILFRCYDCEFSLHSICALSYPSMMRHKIDKHPLKLSYLPIENHKSKYFCEVCEEEFDPNKWFYHCEQCQQSIHCACISVIRRYEESKKSSISNVYEYFNIKFGDNVKLDGQPHSLSFAPGIKRHGRCKMCGFSLDGEMIFKCIKYEFAIHYVCRCRILQRTMLN